jgi:hypothetical protein
MEHPPRRSPDEEPHGPEAEQLYRGEIDLTGVVRQDDALADVIGDAIGEAEAGDGGLPEWGARTLARALANERDDPISGALHHFAVTGRVEDRDRLLSELVAIDLGADEQLHEWVNWLGNHVSRMPAQTDQAKEVAARDDDTPDLGASPEEFTRNLRQIFAEADARGEPIGSKDARALATILSIFLDPDSEMARFADTGDANPATLHQETQSVRRLIEHVPGADTWIDRFEQHLAARSDLGRQPQSREETRPAPSAEQWTSDDLTAQGLEALVFGDELDQVRAYLRMTFARADARGEPIPDDSARFVAKLLGAVLGPRSALSHFAESGVGDPAALHDECQQLTSREWPTADITIWAHRFEHYLVTVPTASSPLTPSLTQEAPTERANPQVAQGLQDHGDAFQAYLQLPDIDPSRKDLLQSFTEFYVGVYDSIDAVIRDLTEDIISMDEQAAWAAAGISAEEMVRAGWDIVEVDGKLYVFTK